MENPFSHFFGICILALLFWSSSCQQSKEPPGTSAAQAQIPKLLTLTNGDAQLTIDPQLGGRVTSLTFSSVEFLAQPDSQKVNFGATFWPSPQKFWHWPPPHNLHTGAYGYKAIAGGYYLQSKPDTATQLQFEKEIQKSAHPNAFDLTYSMRNTGAETVNFAPWEVIAVKGGGVVFFPTAQDSMAHPSTLKLEVKDGISWYFAEHDPEATKSTKAFQDGAEGWIAYAFPAQRVMLVVHYPPMKGGVHAPTHAEVEIYHSPKKDYVELENQGSYTEIAENEQVLHQVRWQLCAIPDSIAIEKGNPKLVQFVRVMGQKTAE